MQQLIGKEKEAFCLWIKIEKFIREIEETVVGNRMCLISWN
jgi:hypothetical protein